MVSRYCSDTATTSPSGAIAARAFDRDTKINCSVRNRCQATPLLIPTSEALNVVCAEVDADFLEYTAGRGNDLSTPRPHVGFAGLQPGDRWCLCAARWEEARRAGVAPPVVLDATHPAALRHTTRGQLETHATSRTP